MLGCVPFVREIAAEKDAEACKNTFEPELAKAMCHVSVVYVDKIKRDIQCIAYTDGKRKTNCVQ